MTSTETNEIRKVARINDKSNNTYLDVIEFPISSSQTASLELLPSVVSDRAAFAKRLRDAGAVLPKNKHVLSDVLEAVANSDAPEEWLYEAQTGWLPGRKAFVQVCGVIGEQDAKIIGINRSKAVSARSGIQSAAGTWKAWREGVAEPARCSTTLMLAVCAPLAAPLLDVMGRQSFTINLFGPSGAGKSMATLVAGSMIGIARTADLISWKITNARLEERLPEFNDSVFPIDDLNTMEGDYRNKYPCIRDLAYNIAQGHERERASAYTAAHGGAQQTWKSIVLTSCEKSVHDMARMVRLERQQGESRRLIDVPAVFDGRSHIFDRAPEEIDDIDAWKAKTFAELSDTIEQNHGKAFRKYIRSLIARGDSLEQDVSKAIDTFLQRAAKGSDGEVARDVTQKFGLLYAGGVLGIQCKLLPWTEHELLEAVAKSYFGARDLLPDTGAVLRRGKAAFRTLRNRLPFIKRKDRHVFAYENSDGFKENGKAANRYLIKGEAFKNAFSSGEEQALVTNWLTDKRRITLATPKKSAAGSGRKPQEQFVWPDGQRRRSIEIFWPKKKKPKKKKAKRKDKAK
jgi:Domain of unknown function (DUF927)